MMVVSAVTPGRFCAEIVEFLNTNKKYTMCVCMCVHTFNFHINQLAAFNKNNSLRTLQTAASLFPLIGKRFSNTKMWKQVEKMD